MNNLTEGFRIKGKWFEIINVSKVLNEKGWKFDVTFELEGVTGHFEAEYQYRPSLDTKNRMYYRIVNVFLSNYKKIRRKTFEDLEHDILHAIKYHLMSYFQEIEQYEDSLSKPPVEFLHHNYSEKEKKYILYFKFNDSAIVREMQIYTTENDKFQYGLFKCFPDDIVKEEFEAFSSWRDYVWEVAKEHSPLRLYLSMKY